MAPEITISQEEYSTKVDIWAFGIMIYELYVGQKPFPAKNLKELKQMQKLPFKLPKNVRPTMNFSSLIDRCL